MENLFLTQLSTVEIRELFREELEKFFSLLEPQQQSLVNDICGIDEAVEITGKAKPTIYGLVSARKIPHSKRGKQLYFSRKELTSWITSGKRKTQSEIAADAQNFSSIIPK